LKENAITVIGAASVISHLSCPQSKEQFVREEATVFAETLSEKLGLGKVVANIRKFASELSKPASDSTTLTVDSIVDCVGGGDISVVSCTRDLVNIIDRNTNWLQEVFVTTDPVIREFDVSIEEPEGTEEPECTADTDRLLNKTFKNGVSGTAPFDLRVTVDSNTHCGKGVSSSWILRSAVAPDKTASGLSFSATLRTAGSYDLLHRVKSGGKIIAADTTKVTVNPSASGSGDLAGVWYASTESEETGKLENWVELRGGPDQYQGWYIYLAEKGYDAFDLEPGVPFCSPGGTVNRKPGASNIFLDEGDETETETLMYVSDGLLYLGLASSDPGTGLASSNWPSYLCPR
jgi:hypothetical protein